MLTELISRTLITFKLAVWSLGSIRINIFSYLWFGPYNTPCHWGIAPSTLCVPPPTAQSPSWQVLPSLIWTSVLSNWHCSYHWPASPPFWLLDANPLTQHNSKFSLGCRSCLLRGGGRILAEVPSNLSNSESGRTIPKGVFIVPY